MMTTLSDAGSFVREPLNIPESAGAPIMCDMTDAPDTPDERLAEYARLYAHALIDRKRTDDAVEFRFAAKPGVAEWVADLARREAACCRFLSYQVSFHSDCVIWRTSSNAGAAVKPILDEFYAGPENFIDGMKGMNDRLAARGVVVTTDASGRLMTHQNVHGPGILNKVRAICGC